MEKSRKNWRNWLYYNFYAIKVIALRIFVIEIIYLKSNEKI